MSTDTKSMKTYTNSEIIQGFRRKENIILYYIYKSNYRTVASMILANNGSESEVKDIIQDALIIIFKNITKPKFDLTCDFNTYFFSVCRILWLQQLQIKKTRSEVLIDYEIFYDKGSFFSENINAIEDFENKYLELKKTQLFRLHFKKLGKDCKVLLKLFFSQIPDNRIKTRLKFKSAESVKARRYQCKEYLVSCIKNDPDYKELIKKQELILI